MDYASAAMEEMELYRRAHPESPSAVRPPRLFFRSELWIALLGPSIEEGIVGIGPTVQAALRAFDAQYVAGLRPPVKAHSQSRRASAAGRRSAASPLNGEADPKSGGEILASDSPS